MVRINLTTEDIFVKNGQRIKILTNGIDTIERFDENPIMLFEHNPEKILGKWSVIEKDEDRMSAIPDFDEDELSVDIGKKLKRGTIKSASIGIEINDAFLEGDVLVISKSVLLEASIVGIPANKNAKTVDFTKGSVMLFSSNGEEVNTEDYIKKLNLTNMKDPKIENLETKVEEVKVEETKVEPTEVEKLTLSINDKDSTIDELNSKIEKLASAKIELSAVETNLNKQLKDSKTEVEKLTLSINDKDSTIDELNNSISKLKEDKLDVLLNSAVSEGKITKESIEDFKELSYDKAESLISKLIPSEVSLTETLSLNKRGVKDEKTYNWYLKNDKEGLRKLSKENPALYKQLENK